MNSLEPKVADFAEHENLKILSFPHGTKYHRRVVALHERASGEQKFELNLDPKLGVNDLIRLNPSSFNGWRDLRRQVESLLGTLDLPLTRLDHAVDIPFSVEDLLRSIIFPRKKSREVYKERDKVTGFYIGQNPKLLVYNKNRQLKIPEDSNSPITRIELRQMREKIEFKSFHELPKFQSSTPFVDLQFKRISNGKEDFWDSLGSSVFSEVTSIYGLQGAKKRIGRSLGSTIKRILEIRTDIPNLDLLYQENLRTFFKEEENE